MSTDLPLPSHVPTVVVPSRTDQSLTLGPSASKTTDHFVPEVLDKKALSNTKRRVKFTTTQEYREWALTPFTRTDRNSLCRIQNKLWCNPSE